MIESISAITLATHNMSRAVRFYRMLGFEIVYGGDDAAFTSFRAGTNYLNLISQPAERIWSWWGRVIFYHSDLDALYASVFAAGKEANDVTVAACSPFPAADAICQALDLLFRARKLDDLERALASLGDPGNQPGDAYSFISLAQIYLIDAVAQGNCAGFNPNNLKGDEAIIIVGDGPGVPGTSSIKCQTCDEIKGTLTNIVRLVK
jgi:catechol 2,3-dioxygenase-like lactoylglutathione lyase family enzyme